jgi:cation:H+ antiporter
MSAPAAPPRSGSLAVIGGAFLLPAPWLIARLLGLHPEPLVVAALSGLAILGAAFLLSWAAEVLQKDLSQAFALALLALIAVLPEYAVDAVFAYEAGRDPVVAQEGYAIANMTGANRLLIGASRVRLERGQALEMSVLLLATVYALLIPFKGELNLLDTAVLLALFGAYMWLTIRVPSGEPELVGPAELVGQLPAWRRRAATFGLFAFAGLAIFLAAEPFAHSLVDTGRGLGVDEFLLVQWLAPLASETPEFIVALLFVWRGHAAVGMRTLVSSKVNQWTLLVATLPLVFSLGAGGVAGMPLVERQQHELWLTAAQSLFAIMLISDFAMNRWEALALLVPFAGQLLLPQQLGPVDVRLTFTFGYLIVALLLLLDPRRRQAIIGWPTVVAGQFAARAEPPEYATPARNPAQGRP